MVMIDYQFSTPPETAFKPELSNHVHDKASSIALYKRLKKKGLLEDFHSKILEGMTDNHSMYLTPEKEEELKGLPQYYCSLTLSVKG